MQTEPDEVTWAAWYHTWLLNHLHACRQVLIGYLGSPVTYLASYQIDAEGVVFSFLTRLIWMCILAVTEEYQ